VQHLLIQAVVLFAVGAAAVLSCKLLLIMIHPAECSTRCFRNQTMLLSGAVLVLCRCCSAQHTTATALMYGAAV
jgi:hypothetical protein